MWYHIFYELGHFTIDLMLNRQHNPWNSAILESMFFTFANSCITAPQAFYKILVCCAFIGVLIHYNFGYVANQFNNNKDYCFQLLHFGVEFFFLVLTSDLGWCQITIVSFVLFLAHLAWEADAHPNQPIRLIIVALVLIRLLHFWSYDYVLAAYLFA